VRTGHLAIVAAVLTAPAGPCGARLATAGVQGAAEVLAGGGYDTNMRLVLSPDAVTGTDRLAGGFSRVAPALMGGLAGGGVRFEASYAGDHRWSPEAGHLYGQEAVVLMSPPALGPVSLELSVFGGRVDATILADERRHFVGGEASLRIELAPSLRALGAYRAEVRFPFGVPPIDRVRELLQLAEARLAFRPQSRLEFAAFGDYLRLEPLRGPEGPFKRARGGLEALVVWRRLTATAAAWAGPHSATDIPRALYGGVVASARVQITAHLDAFATGETAWPLGARGNGGGEFERVVALVGIVAHAATRPRLEPPSTGRTGVRVGDADVAPVVEERRARLRVKAPGAAAVHVVGSWDDWAAPGRALAPAAAAGLWEAWIELPPGSHRYRFIVDGRTVRPPRAPRYIADGFGGEDGVIDVGEIGADHRSEGEGP
jgi:hypothetical protein